MNWFSKIIIGLIIIIGCFWAKDTFFPNAKINFPSSVIKEPEPVEIPLNEEGKKILGDNQEAEKIENTARIYFLKLNADETSKLYISKRELKDVTINNAVKSLLKGPDSKERKAGVYSEIPSGTKLLSVVDAEDKIIINMNDDFQYGGGTESINNRLRQLVKTVVAIQPDKNIYLYIEGKQVDVMGGDGVMITQPLNISEFDN